MSCSRHLSESYDYHIINIGGAQEDWQLLRSQPNIIRRLLFSIKIEKSSRFLSESRSCLKYAGKFASCLEGMIGLAWRLIGFSHERERPWGSNALFYLAGLFSRVTPNTIHVQNKQIYDWLWENLPLYAISRYYYYFYFCLGKKLAARPAYLM